MRAIDATVVAEVHSTVGDTVVARRRYDDVVIGMYRTFVDTPPFTDLGPADTTVGRAEEVDATDDQMIGVDRIDPDRVVIPTLVA